MKLTKSQKICFGLLALGLCALAADRYFENASLTDAATAGDLSVTASGADASSVSGSSAAGPESLPLMLAKLSTRIRPAGQPRDAFRPSAAWIAEQPKAAPPPVAVVDDRPDRFRAAHVLKAVLQAGEQSQAWVDGSLIGLGQSIDGFALVAVQPMQATFECQGRRVVLRLPDADAVAGSVLP